jgi:3-oxoacyl-[acyl-carrier protein] reductase
MTARVAPPARAPVALLTGGTRGIGLGIARRLAREGYRLALNYRADDAGAAAALREVGAVTDAATFRADVADARAAAGLVADAVARFGHLDVLVNNAGPYLVRPFVETSDDDWRVMLDGNLTSMAVCTREALRVMRRQRSGQVVSIGALNVETSPFTVFEAPAYAVAKAGVVLLTRALSRSEAPHGIRVNCVSPGYVETADYGTATPEARAEWRASIPMGRFGDPADVAAAVAWLVSDEARYVTGAVLHLNGGLWL